MADAEVNFIFLSYGHDHFTPLALRLKADLERLGHEVWFDQERLQLGADWESCIDHGLLRTAAEGERGRFVLLMTPHSVRLPAGYCLNELSRALSRNLTVIPVMVDTCEPPLSICRLQWLDLRTGADPQARPEAYAKGLASLVQALVNGRLDGQGLQAALIARLRPIDFTAELRCHQYRFVGRDWIIAKIDHWLASPSEGRVLWLSGGAGTGKSALAHWLAQSRREVAALHFCRFGQTDTTDAARAWMSIAYQLATQWPDYMTALQDLDFASLDQSPAATVFDRLMVQHLPAYNPQPHVTPLIVIDGLDEASADGTNTLADTIASEFGRCPGWLRLMVLGRPEAELQQALQGVVVERLDGQPAQALADARAFIQQEFAPLVPGGVLAPATVDALLDRSEGLFLYLRQLLGELAAPNSALSLDRIAAWPRGLGAFYDQAMKRRFADKAAYRTHWRPLIELVVAAREPLDLHMLAQWFGWSAYTLQDARAALGTMFIDTAGLARPFHKSLFDWLTDSPRAGHFFVDPASGNQALAWHGWSAYGQPGVPLPGYFLRWLPAHLAESRQDQLEELLAQDRWIRARLATAGAFALAADYQLLRREGSPVQLIGEALRLSAPALSQDAAQLPGQLIGRLAGLQEAAIVRLLADTALAPQAAWLRPLQPNLTPPGSSLLATLTEPVRHIEAMALSADGGWLAYASIERDRSQRMTGQTDADLRDILCWPVNASHAPTRLCSSRVEALALAPQGRQLAIAADGRVALWPVPGPREGAPATVFSVGPVPVLALAYLPMGEALLVACGDGHVQHWDLGAAMPSLAHINYLPALADIAAHQQRGRFGGTPVTLAAEAGLLWLGRDAWSLATGQCLHRDDGGTDQMATTPDGLRLLQAHGNQAAVWQVPAAESAAAGPSPAPAPAFTLPDQAFIVSAVALSADGRRGATASGDVLKIWDLSQGRVRGVLPERAQVLPDAMSFAAQGRLLLASYSDGSVRRAELASPLTWSTVADVAPGAVLLQADPQRPLAWFHTNQGLQRLDLQTGALRTQRPPVTGGCLAVTPDGRFAVTAGDDRQLVVWAVDSGQVLHRLQAPSSPLALVLAPDATWLVAGMARDLVVWDLAGSGPPQTLRGHSWYVDTLAMARTPAGWRVVSGSRDKTVRIWDPAQPQALFTLTAHTYSVFSVAISADGQTALSCGDKTLRLWDTATGTALAAFHFDREPLCCAMTADGQTIATADLAGELSLLATMPAGSA